MGYHKISKEIEDQVLACGRNKMPIKDCAKKFGVSTTFVYYRYLKNNIPIPAPGKIDTDKEIGKKSGMLTITGFLRRKNSNLVALCTCDCGKTTNVDYHSLILKGGKVVSCGCYRRHVLRIYRKNSFKYE